MNSSAKDIIEFTLLFNRYKTKVYNYVLRMINDRMTTEDIVQNVFMKLFENINSIRKKNSIKYWIYTTARNEVFTFIRGKKTKVDQFNVKDTDETEVLSGFDTENRFELKETKLLMMKELENMAYEQREIFLLKEYGGLSYKEIASIMNIDENLVKSRLYKVRRKLIDRIAKLVS